VHVGPGVHIGYRRNTGAGTWSVRVNNHGVSWIKKLAVADDFEAASPPLVMTYWQALEQAIKLARQQPGAPVAESRPVTVGEALDRFEADLKARGASRYKATMPRRHLTGALLSKPVQLLGANELKNWHNGLTEKMQPASVNRIMKCLAAALTLAAEHDPRTRNQVERKIGLRGLPGAGARAMSS
jgi:hypothetical protein